MMTAGSALASAVRPRGPLVRIRLPEPCKPQDEVHAAGSGLQVRLGSNVVSFAWVRGCPPRPIRHGQPRSRTVANPGERWSALLESVLGASPREFESRILRHADLRRREVGRSCSSFRRPPCLSFCLIRCFGSRRRVWQRRPQLGESGQHLRALPGAAAVAGDALLGMARTAASESLWTVTAARSLVPVGRFQIRSPTWLATWLRIASVTCRPVPAPLLPHPHPHPVRIYCLPFVALSIIPFAAYPTPTTPPQPPPRAPRPRPPTHSPNSPPP